jgi:hypothetical protein
MTTDWERRMAKVRIAKLAALCLSSLLVACDNPKTIEGTIWVTGPAGSPAKLADVPVTLLPPKTRGALKNHLEKFNELVNAATKEAVVFAVAETLNAAQNEKASTTDALDGLSIQTVEARKKLEAASAIEEREQAALAVADAPFRAQLDELNVKSKSILAIISQQESLLVPEQASRDAAFAEKKAVVADALSVAKAHSANERRLENELKAEIAGKKRDRSLSLHERYVSDKIKVNARIYYLCANCTPKLCVSIQNTGDKAIVTVEPQLFINGKDATSLVGDLFSVWPGQWNALKSISVENDYKEKVKGLPPSREWPNVENRRGIDQCSEGIFLNTDKGDGKRAWESLGGLNAKTRVEVRIATATIADPQSLRRRKDFQTYWEYVSTDPVAVFQQEMDADETIVRNKELTGRASSIESAEADVVRLSRQLEELKPESATSQALIDAQVQLKSLDQAAKETTSKLAELHASLLSASTSKKSASAELERLEAKQGNMKQHLGEVDAEILRLKENRGALFDDVKAKAISSVDLGKAQTRWYAELLELLKDGGGVAVRSDIDGKYRFEKITWKDPLLFAVSDQRNMPLPATSPLYGSFLQRIGPAFWLETVNTSKTTLVDLGQSASVQWSEDSVSKVMARIASVVGLPKP